MMIHQFQSTEGTVGATASITDRTVNNFRPTGLCLGGAEINIDGVLSVFNADGSTAVVSGEWLVSGLFSAFSVQAEVVEGSLNTPPSSGVDSFLDLNTEGTLTYQASEAVGESPLIMYYEFSDDGGTTVVASATHTYNMSKISSGGEP